MRIDVSYIDRDIARWKGLLKKAGSDDYEIRSQLARFLLVHICGQYEIAVGKMIKRRAEESGDWPLASYVSQTFRPYRQMRFNELAEGVLAKFGKDYGARFEGMVSTDSRGRYNSLIANRNKSAHGQPICVTLGDIEAWHEGGKDVLRAFESALGPSPAGARGAAP